MPYAYLCFIHKNGFSPQEPIFTSLVVIAPFLECLVFHSLFVIPHVYIIFDIPMQYYPYLSLYIYFISIG